MCVRVAGFDSKRFFRIVLIAAGRTAKLPFRSAANQSNCCSVSLSDEGLISYSGPISHTTGCALHNNVQFVCVRVNFICEVSE